MTQNEYDRWLDERHMEAPSNDLASRISAAAAQTPQQQARKPFWQWSLPKPAYAFASLLIIGGVLSLGMPQPPTTIQSPTTISDGELLYDVFDYSDDSLL